MENLETYYRQLYEKLMGVFKASENSPVSIDQLMVATGVDRKVVETMLDRMLADGVLKAAHGSGLKYESTSPADLLHSSQDEKSSGTELQISVPGKTPLKKILHSRRTSF
ncbi:MAG: hypothetical protein V4488_16270 [Pseudomonadota bacterium]